MKSIPLAVHKGGFFSVAKETTMKTRKLMTEIWLDKPREVVFPFFADAHNLDRITPPWLHFRIVTPPPIKMKKGTLIEYRLRLHHIPISWKTELSVWEPPFRFVDQQIKGPYKVWIHEHTFEEKDGGTLVRDEVTYAVPGGIIEPVIHALMVGPDVRKIFAYRQETIREIFSREMDLV